jgi:hypothetical protein
MKITGLLTKLSRISLIISLFFLIPGVIIAGFKPEAANGVSGVAFVLLLICWILNLIASVREQNGDSR